MIKLEVGMYAYDKRNRDFGIGKIVNITTFGQGFKGDLVDIQFKYSKHAIENQEVIASFDIIDLIEIGDYVNDEKVVHNSLKNGGNIVIVQSGFCYTNDEIKSIVTKEQFENCSYRVGE